MIDFSVGTQWDIEGTIELLDYFNEETQINNLYGSLAFSPIGHGRSPYGVPNVTGEHIKDFITIFENRGVKFNYLLNGNFVVEKLRDNKFKSSILDYLDMLFNNYGIKYVTVAVPELVEIINMYYPDVSIKISTILNILSVNDIQKLEGLQFEKVTLGNDAPRNLNDLKKLIDYSKRKKIELELMVTETCLYKCRNRYIHYQFQTKPTEVSPFDPYMNQCTLQRIFHPEEFLKACWIRPEDIHFYEELGINHFKISGRSKDIKWTKRCIKAYIDRKYDGNLMDILGTTPPTYENNSEHLVYLDNSSLTDFLRNHPKECYAFDCTECGYCLNQTISLFERKKMWLNPIFGECTVIDGKLKIIPGSYAKSLQEPECKEETIDY